MIQPPSPHEHAGGSLENQRFSGSVESLMKQRFKRFFEKHRSVFHGKSF
jgi:hypothetical protein